MSLRSNLMALWSGKGAGGRGSTSEPLPLGDVDLQHRMAILMLIAAAIPLMLVFLGTGDAVDMMELFNLLPIREAVRDHHWLMPTLAGMPRLEKPPLAVWIPGAIASLFHSESLWALRAPSVVLGVCTAIATYFIGCLVSPGKKNRPFNLLSGVILLTMLIFLRNARLANYDIYSTAFLTIGAVGLFGITDGLGTGKSRLWFTLLAGVGMGLSNLSKGPGPVATVYVPFVIYALIFHRRTGVMLSLGAAIVLCIAMFIPWPMALALTDRGLDTWGTWFRELRQHTTAISNNPGATAKDLRDPVWYYVQFFGWVFPHTPALVAGVGLPFFTRKLADTELPTPSERRARWGVWLIFAIGLVFISCLAEKKPRYALPLFPFAALLCGAVWQDFGRLTAEGLKKIDPLGKLVLVIQALCFILPPVFGLLIVMSPRAAGGLGKIGPEVVENLTNGLPVPAVVLLLMLTLGAGVYMRRMFKQGRFDYGLMFLALSSVALVFTILAVYRGTAANRSNLARHPAEQASALVGTSPVYALEGDRPWLPSLYYLNKPVHQLSPPDLVAASLKSVDDPFFLMLVMGDDKKDDPAVVSKLHEFEQDTHRQPDIVLGWYDERRHTVMYRMVSELPPQPTTATTPAMSMPAK